MADDETTGSMIIFLGVVRCARRITRQWEHVCVPSIPRNTLLPRRQLRTPICYEPHSKKIVRSCPPPHVLLPRDETLLALIGLVYVQALTASFGPKRETPSFNPQGYVFTLAGGSGVAGFADGNGSAALFNGPQVDGVYPFVKFCLSLKSVLSLAAVRVPQVGHAACVPSCKSSVNCKNTKARGKSTISSCDARVAPPCSRT